MIKSSVEEKHKAFEWLRSMAVNAPGAASFHAAVMMAELARLHEARRVLSDMMQKMRSEAGEEDPFAYDASWETLAKRADAVISDEVVYPGTISACNRPLRLHVDSVHIGAITIRADDKVPYGTVELRDPNNHERVLGAIVNVELGR